MGYGVAHGYQFNVYILEEVFFQCVVMFNFFKFMKVVLLVVVQIMGSMEDDKTFSTLMFLKTKLWN
jgi:hypothetical protein